MTTGTNLFTPWPIGRSIPQFVELLRNADVTVVVDDRTVLEIAN
jgi:hypothetical protein